MSTLTKTKNKSSVKSRKTVRKDFRIDCYDGIFSEEELHLLQTYGQKLRELATGKIKPKTPLQRRFVKVAKSQLDAFSFAEVTWIKYLNRKDIEARFMEMDKIYLEAFESI